MPGVMEQKKNRGIAGQLEGWGKENLRRCSSNDENYANFIHPFPAVRPKVVTDQRG